MQPQAASAAIARRIANAEECHSWPKFCLLFPLNVRPAEPSPWTETKRGPFLVKYTSRRHVAPNDCFSTRFGSTRAGAEQVKNWQQRLEGRPKGAWMQFRGAASAAPQLLKRRQIPMLTRLLLYGSACRSLEAVATAAIHPQTASVQTHQEWPDQTLHAVLHFYECVLRHAAG
jgi:hypothetical protein